MNSLSIGIGVPYLDFGAILCKSLSARYLRHGDLPLRLPVVAVPDHHRPRGHQDTRIAVSPSDDEILFNATGAGGRALHLLNLGQPQCHANRRNARVRNGAEFFARWPANRGKETTPLISIFPIAGYGPKSIGGRNGNGYIASGYDYFDGNKHGGHPAHDIFVLDKNQDDLEDTTNKPIKVLSASGGIVVACAPNWDVKSDLRGGKYIFIYDPPSNGLFYYAHNREIFVTPGKIVKPGDEIAAVGRSGKSAYEKRSPTHLHFMYFVIKDGYPKPENPYQALLKARIIRNEDRK